MIQWNNVVLYSYKPRFMCIESETNASGEEQYVPHILSEDNVITMCVDLELVF